MNRERKALREAACAVVGLRLRLPMISVSLDDLGARFSYAAATGEHRSWRRAVAMSAGVAAERVIFGHASRGSRADLAKMRTHTLKFGDLVVAGAVVATAEAMVNNELPNIFRLADLLVEVGDLAGADARFVVEPRPTTSDYIDAWARQRRHREQDTERRRALGKLRTDYWSFCDAHAH